MIDALATYLRETVCARTYPTRLPTAPTYPAIRYTVISAPVEYELAGESTLQPVTVQLSCYAQSYADVRALAETVRSTLSAYRGYIGGVWVEPISVRVLADMYESDDRLYHIPVELEVWYASEPTGS